MKSGRCDELASPGPLEVTMRSRSTGLFVLLTTILLLVPVADTLGAGTKPIVITVWGPSGRLAGVTVKAYPRKEAKIKGVVTEAVTDAQGQAKLSVPQTTILNGAGLRFESTAPGLKTESVVADHNDLAGDSTWDQDLPLHQQEAAAGQYALVGTALDQRWATPGPRGHATATEVVLVDPESGETITFTLTSQPPQTITNGMEFTIGLSGKAEKARWDYTVRPCWVSAEDGSDWDCLGSYVGDTPVVGMNMETKQVTPSATTQVRVRVPEKFAGPNPKLMLRVITHLGLEPGGLEWLAYRYEKR
jgi:hypothetical protein